ncbi:hypothetical protein RN001_003764, partial [Aquatica leii]
MSYYEKEQARLLRLLAEYEAEEEDGGELLSSEESEADENVYEQDVQCDMDMEEEVEQSSDVEPEEEPDGVVCEKFLYKATMNPNEPGPSGSKKPRISYAGLPVRSYPRTLQRHWTEEELLQMLVESDDDLEDPSYIDMDVDDDEHVSSSESDGDIDARTSASENLFTAEDGGTDPQELDGEVVEENPNILSTLNWSDAPNMMTIPFTRDNELLVPTPGMTPEDFIKHHGTMQFDMTTLAAAFKTICKDYMEPLVLEQASMGVEFCSKVLYEIGPGSRQVKKQDGDKVWKLIFPYNVNNKVITKVAYICTFKNGQQVETGVVSNGCIVLTIKQASLLAILELDMINEISCGGPSPIVLLTPLAGAVFAKEDLFKLSKELGVNLATITSVVNSSAQSGGQYLPNSKKIWSFQELEKMDALQLIDEIPSDTGSVTSDCASESDEELNSNVLVNLTIEREDGVQQNGNNEIGKRMGK